MGSKWCIYRLGDIAEFSYGKCLKRSLLVQVTMSFFQDINTQKATLKKYFGR